METIRSRILSLSERGFSFEVFMWLFTRLSALAMYLLILTGFIGALVMGERTHMNFADTMRWAIMPLVAHLRNTNVADVTPWSSPFWKLCGSSLLLLAVAHGIHGLVVISDDYLVGPRARQIVRLSSIVLILSLSGIGLYLIWAS
jgi:succinate dehydrogenase hydrophobic anchor subunit